MSLINEALKRAQEAQGQATRGADRDIELRPVEPGISSRKAAGWVLSSVVTAAVLLGIFCIYQAIRPSGSEPVQARTPVHNSQQPVAPAPSPAPPETAPQQPATAPTVNVSAPPIPQERAVPAPPQEHTNSNPVAVPGPGSEAPATAPAPPPKPVLRLQGIVVHPTRPSAVINGKTVFVGDKVADKRVLAIDADTVTLTGSGETNVLTLP